MKIFTLAVIILLSYASCGQKLSPQAREAANQCYTGVHWEECGISADHPPHSSVIHQPTKGCPAGYHPIAALFTERDGTHRRACMKDTRQ